MHVLVCGASTRAAAESAARCGLGVTAIDGYADLDQHPAVDARVVPGAAARDLARAAREVTADAVAYLSPFENHPREVAGLAEGRTLLGNPPDVIRRVRDPLLLAAMLRAHGVPAPAVAASASGAHEWLLKGYRSGGGQHVAAWKGEPVGPREYLQQRIDGVPGSIAFVAAAGQALPIGFSRQLVGDARFGARGFRYCGSILAPLADPQFDAGAELLDRARHLAQVIASEFALVGVNGIDFVARDGVPYPIEVNPRWSSSLELVERAFPLQVFRAHMEACLESTLPPFALAAELSRVRAFGKAIVFAATDMVAGDTRRWLDDPDIRDVPHPGESFTAGQPICTVLATADDAATCYSRLVERAGEVYSQVTA